MATSRRPSSSYRITYTNGNSALDDDFVVLIIEAHSKADADLIIQNIERYFKGVTICYDEPEEEKTKEQKGRRPQRAKPKHHAQVVGDW